MSGPVLLLAPSSGLGGGIERYTATVEAGFRREGIACRRLNLLEEGGARGLGAKLRFTAAVRRAVSAQREPTQLVLAHRNLLPVLRTVSGLAAFAGAAVIVHGSEAWSRGASRGSGLLTRANVRVVAASHFTAGALSRTCQANVLHPGISQEWYDTLIDAAMRPRPFGGGLDLMTAFRLPAWRDKGLPALIDAVRLLDDPRVRLRVCGSGPVPAELAALTARYPWCELLPDVSDRVMAEQFASADLFVLATRTQGGRDGSGEGFGLVLVEAQIAGTPVIAPAYGGSGEAFQQGLTGLSPTDESSAALAEALGSLLSDQTRRTAMGRAAADWSQARFEPATYSRHIVKTLLGTPTLPASADIRTTIKETSSPCAASAG